jgi:hypothetical protein
MAKAPAVDSEKIRAQINDALQQHPEGLSPAKMFQAIYSRAPDRDKYEDLNAMQRLYYWLKSMAKSKHLLQVGRSHSSVYRLNNGRPKPEVTDIPKEKRPYTPRGSKNGKSNGAVNDQLVTFLVEDIRGKLDKLVELVTH